MNLLPKLRNKVRRLVTQPRSEMTRGQRRLRWWVDLARHGARELHHDRAGQMAAALCYHTLFSLLPTLVLMLVIMRVTIDQQDREQYKNQIIDWVLRPLQASTPEEHTPAPTIGITPLPEDVEVRPDTTQADELATRERQQEFFEARAAMDDRIRAMFDELENVNLSSIGVVGVLFFIWGATGLLATIERSFNLIFGAGRSRPWYLRLPLYYFTITAGPLIMAGGQVAQGWLISTLQSGAWTNWLAGPLIVLAPLVTTWLVFLAMYTLLPYTKVRLQPALIGSFVAAVLWVLAIETLSYYVSVTSASGTYGKLYGAMALLPLFLLWLWVTWLIVLFGAELSYILQAMKGRKFKHTDHTEEQMFLDPAALVPVAAQIAAAFREGKPCTLGELARRCEIPEPAAGRMLGALRKSGLVHRVDSAADADTYALARPADQIAVDDLLAIGADLLPAASPDAADPAWQLVATLRQRRTDDNTTLADLARQD